MPLPGTIHGDGDRFALTQWSVILAAGRSTVNPELAHTALAQLCQTYWAPLYTFVRSRGYPTHDAQDLTQSFFAYLIEHKIYARVEQGKGKFRSFLLASLKNFLSDSRDRDMALKRGGGREVLQLNEDQAREAESLFQTHSGADATPDADHVFEQSWAEMLVAAALQRLRLNYERENNQPLFDRLQMFLTVGHEPLPSYDDLAAQMRMPVGTLRSHVSRLRAHYREALRAEVRRTVDTEAEVDDELRELVRVLTGH